MRRVPIATSWMIAVSLLLCSPAEAQTIKPFIQQLFFQDIVDSQENPALVLQQARDSADELAKFTAIALATVPVVASSAGLVYVHDPTTKDLRLKTPSFGPSFVERPLTNGRGVFNVGVNYQFSRITFNGAFGTADNRDQGLPLFDNTATFKADGFVQYITKRAFLEARSQSVNVFTSFGITARLDVGAVVPITSLSVEGRTEETYDVTRNWEANEGSIRTDRPTPTGTKAILQESRLSGTGLGDISLRIKYSLFERGADAIALAGDVRLPSGDEEQLLGTGKSALKVSLLAALTTVSSTSLHSEAAYTVGGLTDEIVYKAGLDRPFLRDQLMTVSLSLLGRALLDAALPQRVATVRRTVNTGPTGERAIVVDRFFWSSEHVNLLQLAAGAKFNLGGDWLLSGTVLVPLNRTGFQPGITPAIGLERKWGQPPIVPEAARPPIG